MGDKVDQIYHDEYDVSGHKRINMEYRTVITEEITPTQGGWESRNSNQVEFLIEGLGQNVWTDMSSAELMITFKVNQTANTPFPDADANHKFPVAFPENNLFHNFWSRIDVEINGHPLRTTAHYPMMAYIDTVMNATMNKAKVLETFTGFYITGEDEDLSAGHTTNAVTKAALPSIYKRQQLFVGSPLITLTGKLKIDIFDQDKFIVPDAFIRIKLIKNNPTFWQRSTAAQPHELVLHEIKMRVRRCKLQDDVAAEFMKTLSRLKIARYPIHRREVQLLPLGQTEKIENTTLFTGKVPRRVVIGFVQDRALGEGNLTRNPFNFERGNVQSIWLTVGDRVYPYTKFEPKFKAEDHQEIVEQRSSIVSYLEVMRAMSGDPKKEMENMFLTYERWLKGHTLFIFDLTPDENAANGMDYITVPQVTTVKMSVVRSAVPANNMQAVIFAEWDANIDIRMITGEVNDDW